MSQSSWKTKVPGSYFISLIHLNIGVNACFTYVAVFMFSPSGKKMRGILFPSEATKPQALSLKGFFEHITMHSGVLFAIKTLVVCLFTKVSTVTLVSSVQKMTFSGFSSRIFRSLRHCWTLFCFCLVVISWHLSGGFDLMPALAAILDVLLLLILSSLNTWKIDLPLFRTTFFLNFETFWSVTTLCDLPDLDSVSTDPCSFTHLSTL